MLLEYRFLLPAIAVVVLGFTGPSRAAQLMTRGAQSSTGEINVTADKLSTGDGANQIDAAGNVEIKRGETTIKAEEVRVNRTTQDMEAKGKVSLDDPEWKVKSADAIEFNMEKETGEIQNGDLFLEDGHISMTGRRLQKFGGQTFHIDDGFFTTCLCESGSPSWKFSAEQMDLALEGVGTIKNGYFYIMDVPVFYLPYGIFPLRTERQTGFLFPQFGHSTKEGFRFIQPFFWAMSKSTDSTVKFDIETAARVGFITEFRTLFDRESYFRVDNAYFNETWRTDRSVVDKTIANPTIPINRGSIVGSHRYTTSTDWLTFNDIAVYSDNLYTRELIERFDLPLQQDSDIRRSRFGASRMGVFRNWGDTFFKGELNFFQDFIQPASGTLQRTPNIGLWGRRFLSNFPLEFRWRADGVSYIRKVGGDGLRMDLRPEAVLPFSLASRLFGALSVAPRETVYHLYTPVKSSDRNVSRELVELRGNIGSAVSRVFGFNGLGLSHVKHLLEPEISYLFVPGVNQSNIPIMDEVDRINRRNVFTFAVNNRFWGKAARPLAAAPSDSNVEMLGPGTGDVRQLASLKLALSYDIDKARKGGDSLTDLDLNLRVSPGAYIDMTFDGGVNPGAWEVTQARLAFSIIDPRPILRRSLDPDFNRTNALSLGYQFLRRGPNIAVNGVGPVTNSIFAENANFNVDNCPLQPTTLGCPDNPFNKNTVGNVGANLFYRLTDNLLVNVGTTYDVLDSRFLGVRAITKFLSFCECWTATLSINRTINPAKTSFSFDFSLVGLGNTKTSLK
jgi:LPS-assembly protein